MSEGTFLAIALSHLEAIELPDIPLPLVAFDKIDEGRLFFGVRYYVYASIAHVRKILRGLVQVSDEANWACANVLARHLMEWAAHATFLKVKLPSLLRSKQLDEAWAMLLQLNGGDMYFRRYGAKYLESGTPSVEIPNPIKVKALFNVYDQEHAATDGRGSSQEDYSLLSELSHASAACMRRCMETRENRIVFCAGDDDDSPLPIASASTIDWILSIGELLSLISDTMVAPKVISAIREISESGAPGNNSREGYIS